MASVPDSRVSSKAYFGLFEADLATGELRKSGTRIRLQAQPFRVLTFLLERPGDVVTREEIQKRLWGNDTIVDFDHSLGTAINKIREALGDSAENPRFIETLARRGYRFIAPVQSDRPALSRLPEIKIPATPRVTDESDPAVVPWTVSVPGWFRIASVGVMVCLLVAIGALAGFRIASAPVSPPHITQITFSGRVSPSDVQFESLSATATDGSRIYFPQIEKGRAVLAEALIADGETSPLGIPAEIAAPALGDISPDGSKLLLRNHLSTEAEQALWIAPTIGGAARQISGILAHDATWMANGDHILYASGNNLYIAREDGLESWQFATLSGRAFWLRWSPDGSLLRFTLLNGQTHNTELWEIDADGKSPHRLFINWSSNGSGSDSAAECCGSWTSDGKYFVFQATRNGESNLWQLKEKPGIFGQRGPVQITNGPLSYQAPITSRNGDQVFFIGLNTRSELLSYNRRTSIFIPYAGSLSNARRVEFSRDGQWVAWIKQDDDTLWRSRLDGSERVQLTTKPLQVFMMHWSPDDRHLVVMGKEPGNTWKVYTTDAEGGNLQAVYEEDRNQADPDWSSDGTTLVFGRLPELMAEEAQAKAIYLFNLKTKKMEKIAGSDGLFSPRWSPDGRSIAALSIDQTKLMLFDIATQSWRTLASQNIADPVWARDGKSIFFHDFVQEGQPIYRLSIAAGNLQRVADLYDLRSADVVDYRFAGLSPEDAPLVNARLSTANLYTAEIRKY